MADNLLPVNATDWEVAVENTSAVRYPLDVDALRRARDPWLCPSDMLPWLAHQVGVDFWYDDWDEQTKRRAIAAMPRLPAVTATLLPAKSSLRSLSISRRTVCSMSSTRWRRNCWRTGTIFGKGRFNPPWIVIRAFSKSIAAHLVCCSVVRRRLLMWKRGSPIMPVLDPSRAVTRRTSGIG